ncbi:MAG: hypothetical protein K2G24_03115 [Muribaculaceae bacterium]|nr:hypothetical protein [Muribaculaceae bacterium]
MSAIITFAVIGLFLWFVVPSLIGGKGKKKARQRFYFKLGGAILVLLSVIGLINFLF